MFCVRTRWRNLLAGLGTAVALAVSAYDQTLGQSTVGGPLIKVAQFEHEVTGVAVSPDGRIFVNFPRWTEDVQISVAELAKDGSLKPYPDGDWNSWRNARDVPAENHFVCAQSVVANHRGNLWIVDPGAPAIATVVKGAPKLVQIDLAANQVKRVILFTADLAPQGSYINDIRFTPDGRFAFLSDAGARGALLVVDLQSGIVRRVLDGYTATQAEPHLLLQVEGHTLRRTDGRAAVFNVDGIAVSANGDYLYWQALNGRTLYRAATAALTNPHLSEPELEANVEKAGATEPSDGLWTDVRDRIFFTNFEQNEIRRRDPDGSFQIVVRDPRLHWPDSPAEGPDGSLYFTTSNIQGNDWFKRGAPDRIATSLWRVPNVMQPRSEASAMAGKKK